MNRMLCAIVVFLSARSTQAQDSAAAALRQLEDRWASALVQRDTTTFQQLLAPAFIYTENDRVYTRADVLREVGGGSDTVKQAHNEGMEVHRFGTQTAVVTGWLVVAGRGAGGEFSRRYRFTDTWALDNGRWRMVAAQDYVKT